MKILALSNLYPPNAIGGYEVLCHEVMQALAGRGHEVTVLTSSYGGKEADYPMLRVLRSLTLPATEGNIYQPFSAPESERKALSRRNCEILRQTLAATDPDLIFVWNLYFFDPELLAALGEDARRKVYLLTDNWLIASCCPAFIADYFATTLQTRSTLRVWLQRLRRHFGPKPGRQSLAGAAIFASRFMQGLYHDAGFAFHDETIIYHGISAPLSIAAPGDRSQPVTKGELHLLFAGRIVELKGVHTAIEALPGIIRAAAGVRVRLTILGDDRDRPYGDRLRRRIRELNLAEHVVFAPPVPESDLPRLFAEHDIYLFPSLYEPFSLTLIHALQAGIPTVASAAGGTPEIVLHRRTGMLFQPGDPADLARQVGHLAASGELRQTLAQQARAYAENFTFTRMVGQIEEYLLSGRGKSS